VDDPYYAHAGRYIGERGSDPSYYEDLTTPEHGPRGPFGAIGGVLHLLLGVRYEVQTASSSTYSAVATQAYAGACTPHTSHALRCIATLVCYLITCRTWQQGGSLQGSIHPQGVRISEGSRSPEGPRISEGPDLRRGLTSRRGGHPIWGSPDLGGSNLGARYPK
jgi:hypothetical protein